MEKKMLIKRLTEILEGLKIKQQLQMSSKHHIEVRVLGSEQRESTIFGYTIVFIISVIIDRVVNTIFLQYSEAKKIREKIIKNYPNIKLPQFKSNLLVGRANSKVIEARKLEIEDFLMSLLTNQEFQKNNLPYQRKILQRLGLDQNFYDQPNQLEELEKMDQASIKPIQTLKHIEDESENAPLKKRYSQVHINQAFQAKSQTTITESKCKAADIFEVTVLFHDYTQLKICVNQDIRALEMTELVASYINLRDSCDFRLYLSDQQMEKYQAIMDEELIKHVLYGETKISQFTKWVQQYKPKYLLFRKYLYFNKSQEMNQQIAQKDSVRMRLVSAQIYHNIKREKYIFQIKEYEMFTALYLIQFIKYTDHQTVTWQIIQQIVPKEILENKQNNQSQAEWIKNVILQYGHMYQYTSKVVLQNRTQSQNQLSFEQLYINVGGQILINYLNGNPLYPITIFNVHCTKEQFKRVQDYLLKECGKKIEQKNLALGVSQKGLHIVDIASKTIHASFHFSLFDDIIAYSDQIIFQFDSRKTEFSFQSNQAYQILTQMQDYYYIEQELEN